MSASWRPTPGGALRIDQDRLRATSPERSGLSESWVASTGGVGGVTDSESVSPVAVQQSGCTVILVTESRRVQRFRPVHARAGRGFSLRAFHD